MQQDFLIKLKFIKEGQINIVVNLWVHVLSKMLWKFVKIQTITVLTSTTSFSSSSLICDFAAKGFRATGTMRNDRIMKFPLVDVKEMKKNERGSFDFWSDDIIDIVKWNDNSVVTIGSNEYRVQPIRSAERWIIGNGKVADEGIYDGLGHYPISCLVQKCAV